MAWTYSAWRSQATVAAQAAMLALHLQEIEDKITADVAAQSYSRQSHPLNKLLEHLEKKYDALASAGSRIAGGRTLARLPKR